RRGDMTQLEKGTVPFKWVLAGAFWIGGVFFMAAWHHARRFGLSRSRRHVRSSHDRRYARTADRTYRMETFRAGGADLRAAPRCAGPDPGARPGAGFQRPAPFARAHGRGRVPAARAGFRDASRAPPGRRCR